MVAMLAWLLRSPLAGVSSFRRAISSTPPEAVFSSTRETHLVPGIGAMSSPCASSQAKSIYPIFDEASAGRSGAGQSRTVLSAHLAGAERVTGERKAERKLSS
jgi:hypothetical protein